MKNLETKAREMAEKWNSANGEVSGTFRDLAEELRVLRLQLQAANRELEIYRALSTPKFYPNVEPAFPRKDYIVTCSDTSPGMGWGKGKDE